MDQRQDQPNDVYDHGHGPPSSAQKRASDGRDDGVVIRRGREMEAKWVPSFTAGRIFFQEGVVRISESHSVIALWQPEGGRERERRERELAFGDRFAD